MRTSWLAVAAIGTLLSLGARPVSAGDEAPASGEELARAVAAAQEGANLRAKAKIEAAAMLQKVGRVEEALAALAEVETIQREAAATVQRLLASVRSAAPAAAPSASPRPTVVFRSPAPASATASAFPSSTGWLLSMQRLDGWFRPYPAREAPAGVDVDDVYDPWVTALATVALFDYTSDARGTARGDDRIAAGARRGVQALVAATDPMTGGLRAQPDAEAQALVGWAIVTGYARTGEPSWRVPARKAIEACLARRDGRGLWRSASGTADDDAIATAWSVVLLHEALPMTRLVDGLGVPEALAAAQKASVDLGTSALSSPAARMARRLVARSAEEPASPEKVSVDEGGLVYATALVLGSAAARGGDPDVVRTWMSEALQPMIAARVASGPLAGSWEGADSRSRQHGRTYATACAMLAWQTMSIPWRTPAGD
jgi:hypothetical protein